MATIVDKMPEGKKRVHWRGCMDGQVWRLVEGQDFAAVGSLRANAYVAAKRLGKRVSLHVDHEGEQTIVFLQARDV